MRFLKWSGPFELGNLARMRRAAGFCLRPLRTKLPSAPAPGCARRWKPPFARFGGLSFVRRPCRLGEKHGLLIDWQPVKEGRCVAALRFEFVRDPQGALF